MQRHLAPYVTASAAFTAIGLASGLFYREFTKAHEFEGFTQLGTAHTHFLALGTLVGLLLLLLEQVFHLSRWATGRGWLLWTWVSGVAITGGMQVVKGSMQVAGNAAADSLAIAGISGTGHMLMTAAFVLLFISLAKSVNDVERTTTAP